MGTQPLRDAREGARPLWWSTRLNRLSLRALGHWPARVRSTRRDRLRAATRTTCAPPMWRCAQQRRSDGVAGTKASSALLHVRVAFDILYPLTAPTTIAVTCRPLRLRLDRHAGGRARVDRTDRSRTPLELTSNERYRLTMLVALEDQPWRPNCWRAAAHLRLHQLDQLHELWNRVHPEERQEPVIQRRRRLPV